MLKKPLTILVGGFFVRTTGIKLRNSSADGEIS